MSTDIPNEVIAATHMRYGLAITAYLHEPEVMGFSLTGRVYFDHKDRFKNGRLIRTSDISHFAERSGYLVAFSTTGSVYVLIRPRSELLMLPEDDGDAPATSC